MVTLCGGHCIGFTDVHRSQAADIRVGVELRDRTKTRQCGWVVLEGSGSDLDLILTALYRSAARATTAIIYLYVEQE